MKIEKRFLTTRNRCYACNSRRRLGKPGRVKFAAPPDRRIFQREALPILSLF
jgi:hypothetical protein